MQEWGAAVPVLSASEAVLRVGKVDLATNALAAVAAACRVGRVQQQSNVTCDVALHPPASETYIHQRRKSHYF